MHPFILRIVITANDIRGPCEPKAEVFKSRPAGRLQPSGEFYAAREGYFTQYKALLILKLKSWLQEKKFTAHSKINNYPKLYF